MLSEYSSNPKKVKSSSPWHYPVALPVVFPVASPLILNNVTAGHDQSLKSVVEVSGACSLLENFHDDIWKDNKDYKRTALNKLVGTTQFTSNQWHLIEAYKKVAVKEFGHQDTAFRWSKSNFLSCHAKFNKGHVEFDKKGKVEKTHIMRCCETGCPVCDNFAKNRVAIENTERILKVAEANPGLDRVHNFIFTLPSDIENIPVANKDFEKKLKASISRLIKNLFGVPQSSNLWMIRSVHVVGTNDLFRDRWHCHVTVVPCCVVSKKIDGDFHRSFNWLKPAKKYTKSGNPNLLNFEKINELWTDSVNKIFNSSYDRVNFHYSYIRYSTDKLALDKFSRRLCHRIKYDTRSFIDDFLEKKVLKTDIQNGLVILSQGGGLHTADGLSFVVTPLLDFVKRFKFVRTANSSRTCGLGTVLKKYSDILNCDFSDPEPVNSEEKEMGKMVKSDVEVVHVKRFDPVSKRVVMIKREIHIFYDPFQDRMRSIDSETLEDIDEKHKFMPSPFQGGGLGSPN